MPKLYWSMNRLDLAAQLREKENKEDEKSPRSGKSCWKAAAAAAPRRKAECWSSEVPAVVSGLAPRVASTSEDPCSGCSPLTPPSRTGWSTRCTCNLVENIKSDLSSNWLTWGLKDISACWQFHWSTGSRRGSALGQGSDPQVWGNQSPTRHLSRPPGSARCSRSGPSRSRRCPSTSPRRRSSTCVSSLRGRRAASEAPDLLPACWLNWRGSPSGEGQGLPVAQTELQAGVGTV